MLSQFEIKSTGKQTGNKVAMLTSAIALVAVVLATPLSSASAHHPAQTASTPGVQCPAGSPQLSVQAKDEFGSRYNNSGASGLYRVEVVGSHAWGNHPDSSKARYHGSNVYIVKNEPVKFGPNVHGPLGGQRVSNAVRYLDSLKLDPPYNQSRKRVAAAALGVDTTIDLQNGDFLNFSVDGIRGINPNQQGSYFLNTGDVLVRICLVNATTTPTPTPGTNPQCSDGIDNDGDGKIDRDDLGCHRRGLPQDALSYDPNDNDESNDDDETNKNNNPGLNVIKNPDRSVTRPGHEFTYNITIENTGNVDLDDVKVTDVMPGVLQIVSISDGGDKDGQTVTWKNLSIDAGEKKTVHVTVRVKSNASNQTISNTVKVESDDFDVEDSDTDTDIQVHPKAVEAAITVVPIKTVPVSAKTGATLPLMSVITLAGGATTFALKRYFI